MKIGVIGEQRNAISHAMLSEAIALPDVEVAWFAEANLSKTQRARMYGTPFDPGTAIRCLRKVHAVFSGQIGQSRFDCRALCRRHGIPYLVPTGHSLNEGLPTDMYNSPCADTVVIAGCDQLLNEQGLKLARATTINYHYSLLPAYRGKFAMFWQWYNREPTIGYTFHKVDLGVDTGAPVFQSTVPYIPDEDGSVMRQRIVTSSASRLDEVLHCLRNDKQILVGPTPKPSYYPAKAFYALLTATSSRTIKEVTDVLNRTGYLLLPNRLPIARIVYSSREAIDALAVGPRGIRIPLADGHICGVPSARVPFSAYRALVGDARLLASVQVVRKR